MPTLKSRAEFLAVRGGRRASTPSFLLEMRERKADGQGPAGPRFGFTITKKVGNAVTRNRIRRRLKAAFAGRLAACASHACDYVVVARAPALDRQYDLLLADIDRALGIVHGDGRPGRKTSAGEPQPAPSATAKRGAP